MGELRERRVVEDLALGGRVLHQDSEDPAAGEVAQERVAGFDLDSHRPGARLDDGDRLRMAGAVDEEDRPFDLLEVRMDRGAHVHRLGGGGGLVEQRGVRDRERGQVGDQGLEVEQRLEAPLRDLGLVGRVLRVPARILEDVPLDHAGHAGGVVAEPEIGARAPVARRRADCSRSSISCSPGARFSPEASIASDRAARIDAGTVSATSASIEPRPRARSISPISASFDPIWRRAKVSSGSNNSVLPLLHELAVGLGIHQAVEIG